MFWQYTHTTKPTQWVLLIPLQAGSLCPWWVWVSPCWPGYTCVWVRSVPSPAPLRPCCIPHPWPHTSCSDSVTPSQNEPWNGQIKFYITSQKLNQGWKTRFLKIVHFTIHGIQGKEYLQRHLLPILFLRLLITMKTNSISTNTLKVWNFNLSTYYQCVMLME